VLDNSGYGRWSARSSWFFSRNLGVARFGWKRSVVQTSPAEPVKETSANCDYGEESGVRSLSYVVNVSDCLGYAAKDGSRTYQRPSLAMR
jgi:hypothetical protein